MSVLALRWAAEQHAGGPMPKLVLYALAEHANRDGRATTSVATLAQETEASERTVRRALDALADRRLIVRARRQRGTGADTSNEYRLTLDRPQTTDTTAPSPGGHRDTPAGHSDRPPLSERHSGTVTRSPHAGVTVTPQGEPELLNRKKEPSSVARPRTRGAATAAELSATAVRPDAYRLVAAWRTETGAAYRPATLRALAKHADTLLRDGGDPAAVRAALDEWDRRPNARPGLLPHLYDDAIKARRQPNQATSDSTSAPRSKRDTKVAGWFALAARLAAEEQPGTPGTPTVHSRPPAIEGGRSA